MVPRLEAKRTLECIDSAGQIASALEDHREPVRHLSPRDRIGGEQLAVVLLSQGQLPCRFDRECRNRSAPQIILPSLLVRRRCIALGAPPEEGEPGPCVAHLKGQITQEWLRVIGAESDWG